MNPSNPSPAAVFGGLGGNFKAAFTYDPVSKQWTSYQNPSLPGIDPAVNTLPGIAMADVQLGKGYWVWVNNSGSLTVNGTIPAITPAVSTATGWNLIGIPTGTTDTTVTERVGLLSVLTRAGFNYDQLLKWEGSVSSFRKASVTKSDGSATIGDTEMRFFNPNAGYWVDVTDPALLQPSLNVTLRPDFNLEPYETYPGPEDINISGGSVPKTAVNQTHVRFLPGEDVQTISLSNTGGGILIWSATFVPDQYPGLAVPWLTLGDSSASKVAVDANGVPLRDYKQFNGVTTVENDVLFLRLDRKNLPSGTYTGKLRLLTSAPGTQPGLATPGLQEYSVIAEVPAVEGEFRGYAKIDTVNGKKNRVPDIDLAVSVYGDLKVPSMLRGFIDSRNALLWPHDVPLAGYYKSNQGNAFQLSGGFVLPPGDQNYEPYDSLLGTLPNDKDVDWNDDGKVDNLNPLPYAIQRSVFFDGALATGDPMNGYEIKGRYTEIIHGMMKEAITLEGTFNIRREKPSAFESRTNLLGATGAGSARDHVAQALFPSSFSIAPGGTQTRDVTIATELELKGLTVDPEWGAFSVAGSEHGKFRIKILAPVPPGGGARPELVLYDSALSPVGWETLKNLNFPDSRPTQGDLSLFIKNLKKSSGTWTISVQNLGAAAVPMTRWALRLYGQPVFDVYGVVKNGATGIAGAQISIAGQPLAGTTVSGADGSFLLTRVPGMPLNITATHPDFVSGIAGLPSSLLTPNLTANSAKEAALLAKFQPLAGVPVSGLSVPGFGLGGGTSTPLPLQMTPADPAAGVRISASTGVLPSVRPAEARGYVMSWGAVDVAFTALNASNPVRWSFGTAGTSVLNPVSRSYTTPAVYPVVLEHPEGTQVDRLQVVVMPTPNHVAANVGQIDPTLTGRPDYAVFCFNPSFTGGGSLPNPNPDGNSATNDNPIAPQEFPATASAQRADFVMLQHCHSASFDLDLAPTGSFNAAFGTDNFEPVGHPFSSHASNRSATDGGNYGFEDEDHNYTLRPAQDRIGGPLVNQWEVEDPTLDETINVANDQGWELEDDIRHAVDRPSAKGSTVTAGHSRYVLTCSIGAAISPHGMNPPTVETSDAYDASPTIRTDHKAAEAMDSGIARNLHYQLVSGPLAGLQGKSLRNP